MTSIPQNAQTQPVQGAQAQGSALISGTTHARFHGPVPVQPERPRISVNPWQTYPDFGGRQGPASAPPRTAPYASMSSAAPGAHSLPPTQTSSVQPPNPTQPGPPGPAVANVPQPLYASQPMSRPTSIEHSTSQHSSTPTTPSTLTSAPSPSRSSKSIHTGVDELVALFNAEAMKIREAAAVLFVRMQNQLNREREEKMVLVRRVEVLEEELARVKGGEVGGEVLVEEVLDRRDGQRQGEAMHDYDWVEMETQEVNRGGEWREKKLGP